MRCVIRIGGNWHLEALQAPKEIDRLIVDIVREADVDSPLLPWTSNLMMPTASAAALRVRGLKVALDSV